MKKRDRLEIINDILELVSARSAKPTQIMYKANLSHDMLNQYMNELISKQFILEHKDKKGRTYSLTEKGLRKATRNLGWSPLPITFLKILKRENK